MLIIGSKSDLKETDHRIRVSLTEDSLRSAEILRNWMDNRRTVAVNLSRIAATLSPDQMQARLEQARTSDSNFLGIALLGKNATAIAYSPLVDEKGQSATGLNYADRPHTPLLRQSLKPVLSSVMTSRLRPADPIVMMLSPVLPGNVYDGAVGGLLSLDRIKTILETSSKGTNMLYVLLDKDGKVIVTHHQGQKIMQPLFRSQGTLIRHQDGISQWVPKLPANISTIEQLRSLTRDLPVKLASSEAIEWPESAYRTAVT